MSEDDVDRCADSFPTTVPERYFARTCHGSGMVFTIWFELRGSIDIERMWEAWQATLLEFPRLTYRLRGRGQRQRWEADSPDRGRHFGVQPNFPVDPSADRALVDPRTGCGARLDLFLAEPTSVWVRASFHHSCCDGFGTARILSVLAKGYQQRPNATRPPGKTSREESDDSAAMIDRACDDRPVPPLEPAVALVPKLSNFWLTIRGRNLSGASLLPKLTAVDRQVSATRSSETELLDQFRRLQQPGCHAYPGGVRLNFTTETSATLKTVLRSHSLPLNDFGVAVTLLALNELLSTSPHSGRWSRRHLMVLNPTNLRQWAHRYDSSNHVGFAFLRRQPRDLGNPLDVLESVHQQLTDVRRYGYAAELLAGMSLLERFPGGLGLIDRLGWFTPTASLTCLTSLKLGKRLGMGRGDQSNKIGDAMLDDLTIMAPIQGGGEIAIIMWDWGEGLSLSFRIADHRVDATSCPRLAESWDRAAQMLLAALPKGSSRRNPV